MSHRAQGISLLLVLLCSAPLQAADAARILEQIRQPAFLQPEGAVLVQNITLDAGMATLHLDRGALFPAAPLGDRPVEMVFLGAGRIRAKPPDQVERRQLELFTGEPVLDAAFQEAVLVVAGDAGVDALLARRLDAAPDNALRQQAEELFARWRSSSERRYLSPDGPLLLDAVGDPVMDAYFMGWFRDAHRGDFMYVVEPDAFEQVTLGQFVPVDVTRREKRKIRSVLHSQQRRGRLIGVELADLGTWNTWISTALLDDTGRPAPAAAPFEPQHYEIDATLDRDLQISASVRVRLRAASAGRRGLRLHLFSDLQVSRIRDGDGRMLQFLQEFGDLTVVLPEPSDPEKEMTLELEYAGTILGRSNSRAMALRSTNTWYPRAGSVDRATYDVTLRYPAKFDLMASGRRLEREKEGRVAREHRILDYPASDFSFEIGVFDTEEIRFQGIDLIIAFDRQSRTLESSARKQIVDTVRESIEFYSDLFGPYPLDHLTVVTAPRPFSQGFLGFVTLSDAAMSEWGVLGWLLGVEDRRTIIAHEIAHQWWGNLIGWRSYRDQWLSEAMANHAALLFARQWEDGKRKVGRGPLTGAKRALLATTEDGRTVESLGPVVLGARLNSSLYDDAYQPIVYQKGAMVLDTLARMFHEETYLEMLGELTRAGRNQPLSTEEFLAALAHMSQTNLDWFAEQFVYGTGLPQVDYTFEFHEREPDGWEVRGEVTQRARYRLRYKLTETDTGFDVRAERIDEMEVADFRMVVPFLILAEPGPDAEDPEEKLLLHGRLGLQGAGSYFSMDTDYEPIDFWMDKEGEALAHFSCESRRPKDVRLRQGIDLAASGEWEPAEAAFRRALESPRRGKVEGRDNGEEEEDDEPNSSPATDARIRLLLAHLYLDQERDEDATREVEAAEQLMKDAGRYRPEGMMRRTRNRMALRQGEYGRVYRRLRKILSPTALRPSTESLLMLAMAARQLGHKNEARKALELARDRGADVTLLTSVVPEDESLVQKGQ